MEILDKRKERNRIRKKIQKRAKAAKDATWRLFVKELSNAYNRTPVKADLAAKVGVNESQINKWLKGQGKQKFMVEYFYGVYYGLDISPARFLLAVNPKRAKVLRSFEFLSGKDFDRLNSLSDEQKITLKGIVLGFLNSLPPDAKNTEKKISK